MKRETLFLKSVIYLMALFVLGLCIVALPLVSSAITAPHWNLKLMYAATSIGLYASAAAFYVALWQGLLLLSYIDNDSAFSELSIHALRKIKVSAAVMSGLYFLGLPMSYLAAQEQDAPGIIVICCLFAVAASTIAVFAAVLQKLLTHAIALKRENDLTV
ncbi:DUF2975 domain-containing protein [Loigolactobacillus backii]|uniref:DUF2975 domain-containing protein n=1 Tax=Loigolactobacillus backii TaxID=375175 RepID=UPI0022FD6B9B|nr:DUF2975 domain-containing protein [Loigolactobacillus backii]MDA5387878.1 DUF2975 domain-containing protein [Loigolactobacillus backii]MDA5390338.1 DUF2975 domain-containing protein [Loigolactobacillus backii]